MKTKSSPSRYRYCISRLSTLAVSTRTPALKVRSTTLPDITFFSLVRTKAPPLPGLTCWKSTTFHSWPSMLRVMPLFRSFVVATSVCLLHASGTAPPVTLSRMTLSQDEQFLGGQSKDLGASRRPGARASVAGPDYQGVLDPDTARARQVDAGLDGDGDPVLKCTCPAIPDDRRFVDLQADAVAQPVAEAAAVAGRVDQVPGGRVEHADLGARPGRGQAGPLRGGDQVVDLALPAGGL